MADIQITSTEGSFTAYLAEPVVRHDERLEEVPGVLVIQEIFGVNEVMRRICDRFAEEGYLALCPDLFWRQQPGVQLTDRTEAEWQRALQLMQGFNLAKGIDDLMASMQHLRDLPRCSGKAGSIGYCLGGKLAYLMATRSPADCNVSYYGVGIETLLGEAAAITRPYLMHIAEEDKFVPTEAQSQIKDALGRLPNVTIHSYPGVDHAFAREGGQHWNAEAAELANRRTRDFFRKHLAEV